MSRFLIATFLAVISTVLSACVTIPYSPKVVQAAAAPYESDAERVAVAEMKQAGIVAQDWRGESANGICKIHIMKMETITIPRLRGEVYYDSSYFDAREQYFPNAGILYGKKLFSDQEMGHIYVCPKCIAAEQAWSKHKQG